MSDIAILRNAVNAITAILSDRNIRVVQRGLEAHVEYNKTGEPVEIVIPQLPDNASPDLIRAVHGFIDHEVGHVLDTNPRDLQRAQQAVDNYLRDSQHRALVSNIHAILEDVYVEQQQAQRFRGAGRNLSDVGEFLLKRSVDPQLEDPNVERLDILLFPAIRALAGQEVYRQYMDKVGWEGCEIVQSLPAEIQARMGSCKSSKEVGEVVMEIAKHLEPQPSSSSDDQPTESRCDDSDEPSQEQKDQSALTEQQDDGSSGSHDQSDDGQDDECEQGDSQNDEGDDSQDDEGEQGDSQDDEGEQGDSQDDEGDDGRNAGGYLSFDEAMKGELNKAVREQQSDEDYVVYSYEEDFFDTWNPAKHNSQHLSEMSSRVDHLIGQTARALERSIKTKSLARWATGYRRGRLDSRRVSRVAMTGRHPELHTDRVYKQREEAITDDAAVSILIDLSGSMEGESLALALDTGYGLAKTLERISIPCEVIGFTTGRGPCKSSYKMSVYEREHRFRFARHNSLYLPIFKGFGERMNAKVSQRFASYRDDSKAIMGYTILGEAVSNAHQRLMQRTERGKLMMVLTDGFPFALRGADDFSGGLNGEGELHRKHSRQVVSEIEASRKSDIIGLGICVDVSSIFTHNITISDVAEVPQAMMSVMENFIIGQVHRQPSSL